MPKHHPEHLKIVINGCRNTALQFHKALTKHFDLKGVNAEEQKITRTVVLAFMAAQDVSHENLEEFKHQIKEILDGKMDEYLDVIKELK